MRLKEMCERFKRFLFSSPVLEDDEVKKCKYCGEVIANTEKEFCSEYCEEFYWRDEYYKKKYGITKCVVCGKEFIKRDSYDDTCSDVCRYKKQILDLENRNKEQGETNINATKMDVKKCKYCGKELEDTNKDFCDNYCEHRYLWNEYCKKKYGVSNCVICGKEFVKQNAMDVTCSYSCDLKNRILNLEKENVSPETALEINNNDCDVVPEVKKCKYCGKVLDDSQKEFCSILCKGLYLATKPCKDETQGVNTRQCVCMSDVEQSRAAQEDNSESVELEENLLPEIENDNCTVQCDCVSKDTRSEETQENLTEIPQESEIKCAFCGELIGRLNTGINGEYCFCSEKCFKYFSHYGKSRYYGVEKCSRCGKEFVKHYKNQKQCYDCGHKSRYF